MTKYYRIIAYTPYCGEEFTGWCCQEDTEEGERRAREFADVLIAENAEEHIRDHVDDLTDEEAREEFYEGCGAQFQEIDYKTYMEEAFEGEEMEEKQ